MSVELDAREYQQDTALIYQQSRRRVLASAGLAAPFLTTSCSFHFLGYGLPGNCSSSLDKNSQPLNIETLLAKKEQVLLDPVNTNNILRGKFVRSVDFARKDRGVWIGYGEEKRSSVDFLNFTIQGIERCGPTTDGKEIQGLVNTIKEHPRLVKVLAGTDQFRGTHFGAYVLDVRRSEKGWVQYVPPSGIPDGRVYGASILSNAFLVSTFAGVAEFDGKEWHKREEFDVDNNPRATHAALDTATYSWAGFFRENLGGLYRIDRNNHHNKRLYNLENPPPGISLMSNEFRGLAEEPILFGRIWAVADPGIISYDPKADTWRQELMPTERANKALDVGFDHKKRVWLATYDGVWFQEGGEWKRFGNIEYEAKGLAFAPPGYYLKEGMVAIATNKGLVLGKIP